MVLSVAGKYALVTGGGSGINLEFVRILLNKGCSVIIGDLNLRPESEELLKQFPHPSPSPSQPSALFHRTDVSSWPQLSALWTAALKAFPTVDIVTPGAGLFEPKWSSFWDAPRTATNPDTASRDPADSEPGHYAVLDVNLTHPIRLSQLAIGHWSQTKQKGSLIHVSSIAGYTAAIGTPLYFASKHGLLGFVRSLGGLKEELGIRVGCVCPGGVRTPMWAEDPTKAAMVTPEVEWIEPEEIARGMYELAVNEDLGDGTVFEVTLGDTRIVPLYNAPPPSGKGIAMPGYYSSQAALYNDLKTKGLKV